MIYMRFRGRLGNQMFQYAAARLAAERLACPLLIEEPLFARVGLNDVLQKNSAYSLFKLFPDLRRGRLDMATSLCRRILPSTTEQLVTRIAPNCFQPRNSDFGTFEGNEAFDADYFKITEGTRLSGYFQSAKYFSGEESRVRQWYSIEGELAAEAAETFRRTSLNPQSTVAVHVRLGDYRLQRQFVGDPKEGWLLPCDYYSRALSILPNGHAIAVFSDEPACAEEYIGLKADFLSDGRSLNLDFAMMSLCRSIIIANSTFSWWAAWLAGTSAKIIAPKYFLGWRRREWFPADIMVAGWEYL